jgi:hypothetical protein
MADFRTLEQKRRPGISGLQRKPYGRLSAERITSDGDASPSDGGASANGDASGDANDAASVPVPA